MKYTLSDIGYSVGGVAILASILVIWQLVSVTNLLPPTVFPPASVVLVTLYKLLSGKAIYEQLLASLIRLFEGFFLAALIGLAVGIPMGLSRTAEKTGDPLVQFLRPMPSVVLIPLAILYFGLGNEMIVSIVTYASIWPVLINTIDGIKYVVNLDLEHVEVPRPPEVIHLVCLACGPPVIYAKEHIESCLVEAHTETTGSTEKVYDGKPLFSHLRT